MSTRKDALSRNLWQNRHRQSVVRRVRDVLRAEILAAPSGGVLPSEGELVVGHGVSRGVIREALDLLRSEGLIERLQGAGTFVVAPQRSNLGIDVAQGLSDGLESGRSRVSWDVLDLDRIPAPSLVAEQLQLGKLGTEVVFLEHLTYLDGRPLAVRSLWFPIDIAEPLLRPGATLTVSVYDLLETVLGCDVELSELKLQAITADPATAPVLGVPIGAPLLLMERLVRGTNGRPIQYGFGRVRGDRFVVANRMVRRRSPDAQSGNRAVPGDDAVPADEAGRSA
ncbi:GntR family transcriptional regulator [Actinopolymorpha sp. B11F2]|uniref:GntR family transcriptional regulator n=1 Tax=Actinopolymorpha sp. B11F2 TaxID=3160862 RepID=UPI0032E425BC